MGRRTSIRCTAPGGGHRGGERGSAAGEAHRLRHDRPHVARATIRERLVILNRTALPDGETLREAFEHRSLPGTRCVHGIAHAPRRASDLRARAREARSRPLDPLNLYNISWKAEGAVPHTVLPEALTGVAAPIVVLSGRRFPTGSHKVGAG